MATTARTSGPSVSVDTAVLTVPAGTDALHVLQVRAEPRGWALPGTVLRKGERLVDAVRRSLPAGLASVAPRQLQVLDDADGSWALAVAHVVLVPSDALDPLPAGTRLVPVGSPGRLPAGHGAIIALAAEETRARYAAGPDPDRLLPSTFTVLDLRRVHEAVAGHPLQKDTFRRAMEPHLSRTGSASSGTRGRPAELFRRS